MKVETSPFHGWNHSLKLSNDSVELVVTTDVGPRILVYKTHAGDNVLKVYENQLGGSNEREWCIRGGHRFWLAPEDEVLSYHRDNVPANYRRDDYSNELLVESLQTRPHDIRKTLGINLADSGSRVTIRHTAANLSDFPITLATWGLTVMAPGGLEIIPQPPLGEHPRDLLPNRGMVLWPYTDISDPRYTFGQHFWLLRQEEGQLPTKIGLAHREKWIGYILGDMLFLKTFEFEAGRTYPDGGCNFETFTNSEMIEIESLGPLTELAPDETLTHVENWYLFPLTEEMDIASEESLAAWIQPFLAQTHLAG
jgi:hypothetical protein